MIGGAGTNPPLPRAGDVLRITKAASVQFIEPMLFRVIRVHDWATYDGWVWLDGYQLNGAGDAVERRSIFVQVAGLQSGQVPAQHRPARTNYHPPARQPANPDTAPARRPQRQTRGR